MSETPYNARPETTSRQPEPYDRRAIPPLRVHHLLAMTAVTAVLLAMTGSSFSDIRSIGNSKNAWIAFVAFGTIYTFLAAFAVTVTAFGIAWRMSGVDFPKHPGHWLLVAIAFCYIAGTLLSIVIGTFVGYYYHAFWFGNILVGLLNIFIGYKFCDERRWRWVFYLRSLATLIPFWGELPLLVMISRANVWDRRLGIRRDTLHRCGAAVQMAMILLTVVFVICIIYSFFADI